MSTSSSPLSHLPSSRRAIMPMPLVLASAFAVMSVCQASTSSASSIRDPRAAFLLHRRAVDHGTGRRVMQIRGGESGEESGSRGMDINDEELDEYIDFLLATADDSATEAENPLFKRLQHQSPDVAMIENEEAPIEEEEVDEPVTMVGTLPDSVDPRDNVGSLVSDIVSQIQTVEEPSLAATLEAPSEEATPWTPMVEDEEDEAQLDGMIDTLVASVQDDDDNDIDAAPSKEVPKTFTSAPPVAAAIYQNPLEDVSHVDDMDMVDTLIENVEEDHIEAETQMKAEEADIVQPLDESSPHIDEAPRVDQSLMKETIVVPVESGDSSAPHMLKETSLEYVIDEEDDESATSFENTIALQQDQIVDTNDSEESMETSNVEEEAQESNLDEKSQGSETVLGREDSVGTTTEVLLAGAPAVPLSKTLKEQVVSEATIAQQAVDSTTSVQREHEEEEDPELFLGPSAVEDFPPSIEEAVTEAEDQQGSATESQEQSLMEEEKQGEVTLGVQEAKSSIFNAWMHSLKAKARTHMSPTESSESETIETKSQDSAKILQRKRLLEAATLAATAASNDFLEAFNANPPSYEDYYAAEDAAITKLDEELQERMELQSDVEILLSTTIDASSDAVETVSEEDFTTGVSDTTAQAAEIAFADDACDEISIIEKQSQSLTEVVTRYKKAWGTLTGRILGFPESDSTTNVPLDVETINDIQMEFSTERSIGIISTAPEEEVEENAATIVSEEAPEEEPPSAFSSAIGRYSSVWGTFTARTMGIQSLDSKVGTSSAVTQEMMPIRNYDRIYDKYFGHEETMADKVFEEVLYKNIESAGIAERSLTEREDNGEANEPIKVSSPEAEVIADRDDDSKTESVPRKQVLGWWGAVKKLVISEKSSEDPFDSTTFDEIPYEESDSNEAGAAIDVMGVTDDQNDESICISDSEEDEIPISTDGTIAMTTVEDTIEEDLAKATGWEDDEITAVITDIEEEDAERVSPAIDDEESQTEAIFIGDDKAEADLVDGTVQQEYDSEDDVLLQFEKAAAEAVEEVLFEFEDAEIEEEAIVEIVDEYEIEEEDEDEQVYEEPDTVETDVDSKTSVANIMEVEAMNFFYRFLILRGLEPWYMTIVLFVEWCRVYLSPLSDFARWLTSKDSESLVPLNKLRESVLNRLRGGAQSDDSDDDTTIATQESTNHEVRSNDDEGGPESIVDKSSSAQLQGETRVAKPRPNPIYRYLLGYGQLGHILIMECILAQEWLQTYLPALALSFNWVAQQMFPSIDRQMSESEAAVSQTTGFVAADGSAARGGKKRKAQTRKEDERALSQLQMIGDVSEARYRLVSKAFMERHGLGQFADESTIESEIETEKARKRNKKSELMLEYEEPESDAEWIVSALTNNGNDIEPGRSVDTTVEVSFGSSGPSISLGVELGAGGKLSRKKRSSISDVTRLTTAAVIKKQSAPRVSDRESGMMGRIRAAGASSLVGRSLLGAYPGDAPPPCEAADSRGLFDLAEKYGYGEWSDFDEPSDEDDERFSDQSRTKRHRKSRGGSTAAEKPKKKIKRKRNSSQIGVNFDFGGAGTVKAPTSTAQTKSRGAGSQPFKPPMASLREAHQTKTIVKSGIDRLDKLKPAAMSRRKSTRKKKVDHSMKSPTERLREAKEGSNNSGGQASILKSGIRQVQTASEKSKKDPNSSSST